MLPPWSSSFSRSLSVSFTPSPADLAALSWSINYNFLTLTLTKEHISEFVSTVYSSKESLYLSNKDRDAEQLQFMFSADTVHSLRELADCSHSANAACVLKESQTWAAAKISELVPQYKEELASGEYENYRVCWRMLEAFKDVKQPPAVHECVRDLQRHVNATRNDARQCMREFKIGDVPSDVCTFVADKMATLKHIALTVPLVEDEIDRTIQTLLEEIQDMQKAIGTHKRPSLKMLYNYLYEHRLEAAKLVCKHKLFAAQNNIALNKKTAEFGSEYAVANCSGTDPRVADDLDREALKAVIDATLEAHSKLVMDTLVRPICASLPLEARLQKLALHAKGLIPQQKQMKKGPAAWTATAWESLFGGANASLANNRTAWLNEVYRSAPDVIASGLAPSLPLLQLHP